MPKSNYTSGSKAFKAAPQLPQEALPPHDLELNGCLWLDRYVEFSQEWSPRSFDGYHEAIGLWILSTVAARRVAVPFGGERYTNLYILLVGRTSLYAKTTAVKIAKELLSKVELSYLLLPDETTPQRMLVDMSSRLPENWEKLVVAEKDEIKKRLAFAGQKGWYHDEFGQNIQSMMKKDGPYADFRGILRKMDDTGQSYEKATISRGVEVIDRPYLALLGVLTPADLVQVAHIGSILWGDGYLARMGLVVPTNGFTKEGRFPEGARIIPPELTDPIRDWHMRLGIPDVNIEQGQLHPIEDRTYSKLEFSQEATNAYYNYDSALRGLLKDMTTHDFDGNYARFPEKALRISALFASLEGCSTIELRHWAKAQGIVERWRSGLHSLYKQVNEIKPESQILTDEMKVKKALREKIFPTAREIQQYTGIPKDKVHEILDGLIKQESVSSENAGRTTRYRLLPPKDPQSKPDDHEPLMDDDFPPFEEEPPFPMEEQ